MSKKVSQEQYEKTFSYKFKRWLDGSGNPFLDTVEMKPQKEFREEDEVVRQHDEDMKQHIQHVYDMEHNAEMRIFHRVYKIFSILFCVFLVAMLLEAVSELPTFGEADNPVNNEVAERYIESGLQETGAVNIVTGMILDYRAFDTLGESHVLFIATCTVLILLRMDLLQCYHKQHRGNSRPQDSGQDRVREYDGNYGHCDHCDSDNHDGRGVFGGYLHYLCHDKLSRGDRTDKGLYGSVYGE